MWDLPRPGLEPVSPALTGRLSTTVPPGKPPRARVLFKTQDKDVISLIKLPWYEYDSSIFHKYLMNYYFLQLLSVWTIEGLFGI